MHTLTPQPVTRHPLSAWPLDAPLAVESVTTPELKPGDADALDVLALGLPHVAVFVSRAWLSGIFADPPAGVTPTLLLCRAGARLCGAVPIATSRTATAVRVRLLGGGLGSDRVDLLAARGCEAAVADALLAWIGSTFGRHSIVLELRDLPADSPIWGAIFRANEGGRCRFAVQPRELHTQPYLDLTEASFRLSDGACPGGDQKSFDRHFRWLERRGRLRVELLQEPGDVLAAFESLTAFLHARWAGAGGSALDKPWRQRFHRHVLPRLLAAGHLKMLRVSSDIRPIAVFYGLACGSWRGCYLAGYDRAWAGRIHLGRILMAMAIDLAAREGATEFDFLKGAERVKYLWPVRQRACVDADVYSAGAGAQLARAERAAREAAHSLAKAVTNRA
jgi:CelD/BcsL family acetyltransferase involved in cellulose biosynthesis